MKSELDEYVQIKACEAQLFKIIPEFDTESTPMLTPSEIIEYCYCPRFIYFMHCLRIPQREELRLKVLKGRQIHKSKAKTNIDYLRKKINCIKKEVSVYLASKELGVRGVVDEVLFFPDGSASPLDYKYTYFTEFTFNTHKLQSTLYALLIHKNYNIPVYKGYICYVRSKNILKEIVYSNKDFENAKSTIIEIFDIILKGCFPKRTKYPNRCIDCSYRNICTQI